MAVIYAWKCGDRECGFKLDSLSRTTPPQQHCGVPMRRDYSSITMGPGAFQPHFNHAIGMHVNNRREFEDGLKIRAEENSLRTGADHVYSPVLPGDMPAPTTDTDIFETRNRLVHDNDIKEMKVVE